MSLGWGVDFEVLGEKSFVNTAGRKLEPGRTSPTSKAARDFETQTLWELFTTPEEKFWPGGSGEHMDLIELWNGMSRSPVWYVI